MSYTPIQTDSEEKLDINSSSSSPPIYTPAQSTDSPQSPQQQPPQYIPQQQPPQYIPQQQQPVVQYVMQPQPYMVQYDEHY